MKLITFLGTGKYRPAQYSWEERSLVETGFFPEALLQWMPEIKQVLVMLTDEARQHTNWDTFKEKMMAQGRYSESGPSQVVPVDIKTGKNEAEIWQMFDTLVANLNEGDEIILDITHAFRSLPVLSLIASVFMRSARKIQIRHILYGAFEGTDESSGITPVYDLTPFLNLLDWSQSANQLIETGISRNIGQTLSQTQKNLRQEYYTQHKEQRSELPEPPATLSSIGNQLASISNALLLNQPRALAEAVKGLEDGVQRAQAEASVFAKPFNLIQDRLLQAYQAYDHFDLSSMLDLLDWYLDHNHYVQAVTLAREWLVCLLAGHLLDDIDPPKKPRGEIEKICAAWEKEAANEDYSWADAILAKYQANEKIPFKAEFTQAWNEISGLRNDIAHCYMARYDDKGQPQKPNTERMIRRMQNVIQDKKLLRRLPLPAFNIKSQEN